MQEFMRIDGGAPFFPHNCRACTGVKDLIDTFAEDQVGRVYLCRLCITRGARVFGLVKGNRHTELERADELLSASTKESERQREQIERMTAELSARAQRISQLEALAEQMRQKDKQRQYMAGQVIEHAKELALTLE